MEEKIFNRLCEYETLSSKIPIRIYQGKTLLHSIDPFNIKINCFDDVISTLLETSKSVEYHLTQTLLQFGIVRDKSSNLVAVLGPVSVTALGEIDLHNIMISHGVELDLAVTLSSYFNSTPHLSMDDFVVQMQMLYTAINHEIIDIGDIVSVSLYYAIDSDINKSLVKTSESIHFGDKERHTSYDFESKLLFYIQHGMVDKLKSLSTIEHIDRVGVTSLEPLRHYKNIVIIMNSLSARAAIRGGLNAETTYQLAEIYARKVELCNSTTELQRISKHLRMDYCTRVRNLQYTDVNDLTINRAIKYITDHITQKLTAGEIAEHLNISKEYLSSKFKAVTKLPMIDFINIQKIKEAQYLLLYTDEELVRISYYLSFSSQSYFQLLFKNT